jgi:small-conductance mechanosensitive channel
MNEQDFQDKLGDLMSQIDGLPESEQPKLRELAEQTRDRHARMKQTLSDLQASLDHLRVTVKYLVFDLEATRRENSYLRSLVEGDSNAEG